MEGIVSKVLGVYLKKFIKDYNQEMLSLQLLKGTGQMKNFEINGEVLQEILLIPPKLEVLNAKCTELNLKIPFMHLRSEPIVFTLDRVDVTLFEPEVIKPMPNSLATLMGSGAADSDTNKMRVMKTIKIEIKEIHLTVKTLGHNTFHPNWAPSIMIDVLNVSLQTTNKDYKSVELSEAIVVDDKKGVEYIYKLATIESISISSKLTDNEKPVPIIENIPAKMKFFTEFNTTTNVWVSSSLNVLFSELNFAWDQNQWQRLADLAISFQACMQREVPVREGAQQVGVDVTTNKISYGIDVDRWVVELLKGKQGGQEGWTFFGFGLKLLLSPERKTKYLIKDLGGRDKDKEVECWESVLEGTISSLSFREKSPDGDKEPQYTRLISHVLDGKVQSGDADPKRNMVQTVLTRRTKINTGGDETVKRRVPQLELVATSNGMQFVFDNQSWKDFYTFVIEGPIESTVEDKGKQVIGKMKEKIDERDAEDIYSLNAKFSIEANGSIMIVPNDPKSKVEDLKTKAVHIHSDKIVLTNQPEWPFPPFLKDALLALPQKRDELTPEEGTIHKLQGEIHNLSLKVVTHTDKGEESATLLDPASLRVYGRYFPPGSRASDAKRHKLEATMHSSDVKVRVTKSQSKFINRLGKYNALWVKQVDIEEKERRKMNKMLAAAAGGASEMKLADIGSTKKSVEEIKAQAERIISAGVKYGLDNLEATIFFRAERGGFSFPAPSAFGKLEKPQGEAAVKSPDDLLAEAKFEKFEVVIDNNIESQSAVVKLKSAEIVGIDHPLSPVEFALKSKITDVGPGPAGQTLNVKLERKCPKGGPQEVDVFARLQGIHFQSIAKPVVIKGLATRATTIDVNAMVTNAFNKFQELYNSSNRSKIMDRVKEGAAIASHVSEEAGIGNNMSVTWSAELGDCEVEYLQKNESGVTRHVGSVKLSNANKDQLGEALKETENNLIHSKLELANSAAEKMDLETKVAHSNDKMSKMKAELDVLSKQLADIKFNNAEMQAENDNLKVELKKAKSGAPAGAAAPATTAQATASAAAGKVRGFFGGGK